MDVSLAYNIVKYEILDNKALFTSAGHSGYVE